MKPWVNIDVNLGHDLFKLAERNLRLVQLVNHDIGFLKLNLSPNSGLLLIRAMIWALRLEEVKGLVKTGWRTPLVIQAYEFRL